MQNNIQPNKQPTIIITTSDQSDSSPTPKVVNFQATPLIENHNQLNPKNLRPPLRKNSFICIKKDNKSEDYLIDSIVEEKQDKHGRVYLEPKVKVENKNVRHHGT